MVWLMENSFHEYQLWCITVCFKIFSNISKKKKNVRPYFTIHRILKYHISLYACKITFFITLKEDIRSTFYDNPIKCRSQQ